MIDELIAAIQANIDTLECELEATKDTQSLSTNPLGERIAILTLTIDRLKRKLREFCKK